MSRMRLLIVVMLVSIAGITGYFAGHDAIIPSSAQQALIEEPLRLPARTKTQSCIINGSFPDRQCTPGAVFPDATKEKICISGYTKTVRAVSESLKKKVYREYGISYPPPHGSYEADHFIPLALGGNNDIANLFPESAEPTPGFREKDIVEVYLYEKVCSGEMALSYAQRKISTDWVGVYNSISSYDKEILRKRYPSWSN